MIPSIPVGSTLASLIHALQFLQDPGDAMFYRCVIRRSTSSSYVKFGDRRTPVELALKYSTLPMGLATLSDAMQEDFLRDLSSPTPENGALKRLKSMLRFETQASKRCPLCVAQDLKLYGFAYARSVHQVLTIDTCPEHYCLLEESCGDCGAYFELAPYERRARRLLHVCRYCGSRSGNQAAHDRSEGYDAYAELIARGNQNNAPEVNPQQLAFALNRFSDLTIEHGIDLRLVLAKFWRVKTWEEACARIGASSGELYKSLVFGAPPHTVLGAYGLASFFHSCVKNHRSLPVGRSNQLPNWTFTTPYKVDQGIRERAHQLGIPMRIVLLLTKGNWVEVRRIGATKLVRDFTAKLDERQQQRIRSARRQRVSFAWYARRR